MYDAKLVAAPKKRRSYDEARTLRWDHYSNNRPAYAALTDEEKEEILNLLVEGFSPELALRRVLEARRLLSGEG